MFIRNQRWLTSQNFVKQRNGNMNKQLFSETTNSFEPKQCINNHKAVKAQVNLYFNF